MPAIESQPLPLFTFRSRRNAAMGFKVIIIGGGLAGSLLANGLIRHHIDCMLYERDEKASLRREGYQIRIGDGALSGFRACLDASRFGALMEMFGPSGSFVPSAPALYDIRGNCLLDLGRSPWSTKSACINRVLLRNFLTGICHPRKGPCFPR